MATTVKTGRTVGQTIEAAAQRWPDRIGVDFGVGAYTYRDLWSRARRAAAALAAQGVKPGEAVLVMLDNTIEFVDAWLGLALIGAIQVPVNTEYVGEILRHQVKDSGAWLVLIDQAYVSRVEALGADRGALRRLMIVGSGSRDWEDIFESTTELPRDAIVAAAEHDIVAIMYTSGTTGPSKGVRVAHAQAFTYAQHAGEAMQLAEGDVYFAPLPLFHIAGQWALVYASAPPRSCGAASAPANSGRRCASPAQGSRSCLARWPTSSPARSRSRTTSTTRWSGCSWFRS